jgi:hypothetical protein
MTARPIAPQGRHMTETRSPIKTCETDLKAQLGPTGDSGIRSKSIPNDSESVRNEA